MRKKSELYLEQQKELVNRILAIIELDSEKSFVLHDIDTNAEKIAKIMSLIPDLRTFFAFGDIVGISEPSKVKRPWLSIIKCTTKKFYRMFKSDYRIKTEGGVIRTKKYTFILKE
jgi:hypothetical protein